MTRSKSKIERRPLPADDPIQRQPDIAMARKHLGWEPEVQIDEGLQKAIDYFRRLLSARADKASSPDPGRQEDDR